MTPIDGSFAEKPLPAAESGKSDREDTTPPMTGEEIQAKKIDGAVSLKMYEIAMYCLAILGAGSATYATLERSSRMFSEVARREMEEERDRALNDREILQQEVDKARREKWDLEDELGKMKKELEALKK